jgi:hypothetical protein
MAQAQLIGSKMTDVGRTRHLDLVRGISKTLYLQLKCMENLTVVANLWSADMGSVLHTRLLVLGRNRVQHGLLSYWTSNWDPSRFARSDSTQQAVDNDLASAETVRIAALIFSDMAFFPLPWALGVRTRLAERMRLVWVAGDLHQSVAASHDNYSILHACVLWFGCLAAFNSASQEWFEVELLYLFEQIYGQPSHTFDYREVRAVLQGFLWWGTVCNHPSEDLWSRLVQRINRRTKPEYPAYQYPVLGS